MSTTEKTAIEILLRRLTADELRQVEAAIRADVHRLSEGEFACKPPTPELRQALRVLDVCCRERDSRVQRAVRRLRRSARRRFDDSIVSTLIREVSR